MGAGIVGASAAYFLARAGARVTVIEKDSIGSHASGFAYGGLIPAHEVGSDAAASSLSELSSLLHSQIADELRDATGVDVQYRRKASVMLAQNRRELSDLRPSYDWLRAHNRGDVRWLEDVEALQSVEPRLSESLAGGLFADISAEVEPYKLTLALGQAAQKHGASLRHGAVTGLRSEGGRLTAVVTGRETIPAGIVIIAAGPWSGAAGDWIGRQLPITPLKGQILRMRAPGPPLEHSYWWGSDYATTKPDGLVWAGTTEERVGFDESPTAKARDEIMASATNVFPFLVDAELVRQTACLRPVSADGEPVIGKIPEIDGVVVATGAGRNGIMLGPGMGRIAADLALGRQPAINIRNYDPGRFGSTPIS